MTALSCLQHWRGTASKSKTRKAILLFHRGHEHSGRMAHLVEELQLPEFDFFAWDARGRAESPGEQRRRAELLRLRQGHSVLCTAYSAALQH